MARALRIERPGGRYHITARGNERNSIYRDDSDRTHFLELLAETTERFALRIHAYVLMENHFHLLLETPEANLSRSLQWLNVSYSVWFIRRHQRAGHLFQGRFHSIAAGGEPRSFPLGLRGDWRSRAKRDSRWVPFSVLGFRPSSRRAEARALRVGLRGLGPRISG